MLDIRQRLLQLLERENISANLLAEISKVPAPTIYRFIQGKIDVPRPSTLCKLAQALKVTEGQMRGFESIPGLDDIEEVVVPITLESVLTPDELVAIEGMRVHDKKIRSAWLLLGKELCRSPGRIPKAVGGEKRVIPDRRRGGMHGPSTGMKYRKPGGPQAEPKKA